MGATSLDKKTAMYGGVVQLRCCFPFAHPHREKRRMWGTFLKMWTSKRRPMYALTIMDEAAMQLDNMITHCRPNLKLPGSGGASAHKSSGSASAITAPVRAGSIGTYVVVSFVQHASTATT